MGTGEVNETGGCCLQSGQSGKEEQFQDSNSDQLWPEAVMKVDLQQLEAVGDCSVGKEVQEVSQQFEDAHKEPVHRKD